MNQLRSMLCILRIKLAKPFSYPTPYMYINANVDVSDTYLNKYKIKYFELLNLFRYSFYFIKR